MIDTIMCIICILFVKICFWKIAKMDDIYIYYVYLYNCIAIAMNELKSPKSPRKLTWQGRSLHAFRRADVDGSWRYERHGKSRCRLVDRNGWWISIIFPFRCEALKWNVQKKAKSHASFHSTKHQKMILKKLEKNVVRTIDPWCFHIMVITIIFNHGSHDMKPWRALIFETPNLRVTGLTAMATSPTSPSWSSKTKDKTHGIANAWVGNVEEAIGKSNSTKKFTAFPKAILWGIFLSKQLECWNYAYIDAYLNWSKKHICLLPHQLCQFLNSSKHCN